jgi:hypothetical protein
MALMVTLYVVELPTVTVPDNNPLLDNVRPVGNVLPAASAYKVAPVALSCNEYALPESADVNVVPVTQEGVPLYVNPKGLVAVSPVPATTYTT